VQGKFDDALTTIRSLTSLSKLGESVEGARMLAGQIYMQQGNLMSAASEFRAFKKAYPNSAFLPQIDMILPEIERRLASSGK
jgi:hypothetical protein